MTELSFIWVNEPFNEIYCKLIIKKQATNMQEIVFFSNCYSRIQSRNAGTVQEEKCRLKRSCHRYFWYAMAHLHNHALHFSPDIRWTEEQCPAHSVKLKRIICSTTLWFEMTRSAFYNLTRIRHIRKKVLTFFCICQRGLIFVAHKIVHQGFCQSLLS